MEEICHGDAGTIFSSDITCACCVWHPGAGPSRDVLGGSAPSLQTLILDRIPFPALPKLLSSATCLISFWLWNIPGTGYISPEAMAACLAALLCLEEFHIKTQTGPLADEQSPPPPTPAVLPSLTLLHFKGIIRYLEHLIARTDSARLTTLSITSYGLILHIPQLHRFIGCASKIKALNRVVVSSTFRWSTSNLCHQIVSRCQ